ncbi:putative membrane protein [Halomonas campaniensis]|uniref:Putative membrane protein n=1 Tax=Halomonas campaniensis TaxID=213554 RepID=A0A7W5PAB3_9GAMM|nr:putative membrane protein [Halomonas campaniensis]
MGAQPTPERLSLMLGLVLLMLATVPRYLAGGHETRLSLILMALAVVAAVALVHWRMLDGEARRRLPSLLGRLGVSLVAGLAGMGLYHALFTDFIGWELLLAHGATLGLLLHALWLWVRAPSA